MKRKSPHSASQDEIRKFRRGMFATKLRRIEPKKPLKNRHNWLEPGNSKTGKCGVIYKSMHVWNLPPYVTCPCSTEWCLHNCYNADNRRNKFPLDMWAENWWMSINNAAALRSSILKQLHQSDTPCAVRVHSSGDFFSKDYTCLWIDIAISAPDTMFWAYTRSWADSKLYPYLRDLGRLKNFQLFASYDSTMDITTLPQWRASLVFSGIEKATEYIQQHEHVILCPEQNGMADNCASCGICIKENYLNIAFLFH